MRSLQGKCLGKISDSRREKEKENQEAKRAVTQHGQRKSGSLPSYDSGKGKGGPDKGKSKTFAATAENLEE